MNTNEPLAFVAGQHYTTRDGREARVYATDGGGKYPVHGAIRREDGIWNPFAMTTEGAMDSFQETESDLISLWTPRPEVNWAAMPAWHDTVIKSGVAGTWFSGRNLSHDDEGYVANEPENNRLEIPRSHAPTFTGDWRNSKVQRPKA